METIIRYLAVIWKLRQWRLGTRAA